MRKQKQVEQADRRRVRFILAWQDYDLDEVVELPVAQVKILIRRGIAVCAADDPVIARP